MYPECDCYGLLDTLQLRRTLHLFFLLCLRFATPLAARKYVEFDSPSLLQTSITFDSPLAGHRCVELDLSSLFQTSITFDPHLAIYEADDHIVPVPWYQNSSLTSSLDSIFPQVLAKQPEPVSRGGKVTTTTPRARSACRVGDVVTAIWSGDGHLYPGTIMTIYTNKTVHVHWADGDTTHTELAPTDVYKNSYKCSEVGLIREEDVKVHDQAEGPVVVMANSADDLPSLVSSILVNTFILGSLVIAFSILRRRYRVVYFGNGYDNQLTDDFTGAYFSWVMPCVRASIDDIQKASSLDQAMLIEFCELCMRMCCFVGLPQLFMLCPLHVWFGGRAAGDDKLSYIGFDNIAKGNWLCWVHAINAWYVVFMVMKLICRAQEYRFLPRRFAWLRKMPLPRATTLMVEGIPPQFRSDEALKGYFSKLFAEAEVESAYVVKRTYKLLKLLSALEVAKEELRIMRENPGQEVESADSIPMAVAFSETGLNALQGKVIDLQKLVETERKHLQEDSSTAGPAGFVTFSGRREAVLALNMRYKQDMEEFIMSLPPDPSDVLYGNLDVEYHEHIMYSVLGHGANVGLLVGFLPIIAMISTFTNLQALRNTFDFVDGILRNNPVATSILDAVLASLALTIVMSFLPSVLMLVNSRFFCLNAESLAQHKLQEHYFWFMLFFVVLVTAIGGSLIQTIRTLIEQPFRIFPLFAQKLPKTSHFFLKYLIMQWVVHGLNIVRYMQLIYFVTYRLMYGDEDAKKLAEPEDQDYYGMGGRSTRFSINIIIAVIFCSLAPIITIFAFLNFALCRLLYTYLFIYAETKKADLGGVFWVTQLWHLQYGLLIYIVLMIGVLAQHANNNGPWILTTPCLFIWLYGVWRFRKLRWESLPFEEIADNEISDLPSKGSYLQPELNAMDIEEGRLFWIKQLKDRGLALRDMTWAMLAVFKKQDSSSSHWPSFPQL